MALVFMLKKFNNNNNQYVSTSAKMKDENCIDTNYTDYYYSIEMLNDRFCEITLLYDSTTPKR
jgi:hypothetical protein